MSKNLLLFFLMGLSSMTHGLDVNTDKCEFFYQGELVDDSNVAELLNAIKDGEAVKVCTGGNGNRVFYVASSVSQKGDVSFFYLTRVFRTTVNDGYRWDFIPPENKLDLAAREVYMRSGSKGFKQDDSGFVQAKGVSVGLFSMFINAWAQVCSSEDLFSDATNSMPMLRKLSSDVKLLKNALFNDGDNDVKPKILRVEYVPGADFESPHYVLSVAHGSHTWDVEFDFFSDAISFESIDLRH